MQLGKLKFYIVQFVGINTPKEKLPHRRRQIIYLRVISIRFWFATVYSNFFSAAISSDGGIRLLMLVKYVFIKMKPILLFILFVSLLQSLVDSVFDIKHLQIAKATHPLRICSKTTIRRYMAHCCRCVNWELPMKVHFVILFSIWDICEQCDR